MKNSCLIGMSNQLSLRLKTKEVARGQRERRGEWDDVR